MKAAHEIIGSILKGLVVCNKDVNFIPANKALIEQWISSNAKDNDIESYPLIVMQTPNKKDNPTDDLKKYELNNQRFILAVDTDINYTTAERYDINFKPILFPLLQSFINLMNRSNSVSKFEILSFQDVEYFGNTKEVASDKWDYIEVFADIRLVENCNKC